MYNWVFLIWWLAKILVVTRWVFLEISSACSNTNPLVDPCAMRHPGLNQGTHSTVNCKARRYDEGFPLWKGVWTPPKPPVVLDEFILESSLGMLWLMVRGECSCISVCFAIFVIWIILVIIIIIVPMKDWTVVWNRPPVSARTIFEFRHPLAWWVGRWPKLCACLAITCTV